MHTDPVQFPCLHADPIVAIENVLKPILEFLDDVAEPAVTGIMDAFRAVTKPFDSLKPIFEVIKEAVDVFK